MNVAVTADSHLRKRDEYPERYHALEQILDQTAAEGIEDLIIAGDLFDKDFQDYSEFELLSRKHAGIQLHIIPGNHDPGISEQSIVADNVRVYVEPSIVKMGAVDVLFLPYSEKTTMGEKLAQMSAKIEGKPWVLVGHGDYYSGTRELNPLEPGTYMPLSRKDLKLFDPQAVLLGHIHKPCHLGSVHYPGSPCGLDISETGKRSFLVYCTVDNSVVRSPVATDILYLRERFVVVPMTDEISRLRREIERRIEAWGLDPADHSKVCVEVEAVGYSSDRNTVLRTLREGFAAFRYVREEGPKIDRLLASTDRQLEAIAARVIRSVNEIEYDFGDENPEKDEVIVAALSTIYGT